MYLWSQANDSQHRGSTSLKSIRNANTPLTTPTPWGGNIMPSEIAVKYLSHFLRTHHMLKPSFPCYCFKFQWPPLGKLLFSIWGFPGGSAGKILCNAGDLGFNPWLGRSCGEGTSHPLWYFWPGEFQRRKKKKRKEGRKIVPNSEDFMKI